MKTYTGHRTEDGCAVTVAVGTGGRGLDPRQIERTLDGLLDFCGHAAILQLFRRLCRHYSGIDPAAAVGYVKAYREMYGEGESDSGDGV